MDTYVHVINSRFIVWPLPKRSFLATATVTKKNDKHKSVKFYTWHFDIKPFIFTT